jgi:hypothetical protein
MPLISIMEVVGNVASVSQVVVYSFSTFRCLQKLYVELKSCGSAYHDEESNLSLLLGVIKSLSKQGVNDNNPILPVLIEICRLACEILHLLQPRILWGINWTHLAKQEELKSAFQALEKKRELLHLHLAQANNATLAALQEAVRKQQPNTQPNTVPPHEMVQSPPQSTVPYLPNVKA